MLTYQNTPKPPPVQRWGFVPEDLRRYRSYNLMTTALPYKLGIAGVERVDAPKMVMNQSARGCTVAALICRLVTVCYVVPAESATVP